MIITFTKILILLTLKLTLGYIVSRDKEDARCLCSIKSNSMHKSEDISRIKEFLSTDNDDIYAKFIEKHRKGKFLMRQENVFHRALSLQETYKNIHESTALDSYQALNYNELINFKTKGLNVKLCCDDRHCCVPLRISYFNEDMIPRLTFPLTSNSIINIVDLSEFLKTDSNLQNLYNGADILILERHGENNADFSNFAVFINKEQTRFFEKVDMDFEGSHDYLTFKTSYRDDISNVYEESTVIPKGYLSCTNTMQIKVTNSFENLELYMCTVKSEIVFDKWVIKFNEHYTPRLLVISSCRGNEKFQVSFLQDDFKDLAQIVLELFKLDIRVVAKARNNLAVLQESTRALLKSKRIFDIIMTLLEAGFEFFYVENHSLHPILDYNFGKFKESHYMLKRKRNKNKHKLNEN